MDGRQVPMVADLEPPTPVLYRITRKPETEPLDESWNTLRVQLETVTRAEFTHALRLRPSHAAEIEEFGEEPFEAGWRDDLQDPSGLIAGIPEGMPLIARLEDEVAWVSEQHLVTQKRSNAAFENVAVLVLARVPMQRRGERPRGHRVLDERERAVRLSAVNHEPHPNASQESSPAVARSDNFRHCSQHYALHLFQRTTSVHSAHAFG